MFFATVKQRQSGAKFLPAIAHSSLFVISFFGSRPLFVFRLRTHPRNAQRATEIAGTRQRAAEVAMAPTWSDKSEDEIASIAFMAVSWNAQAIGTNVRSDGDALGIPEARVSRISTQYRVSETNGARVYSYDGLDLSLPVEAPGCLLRMTQRSLEAEALAGRNRASSVKLVLDGAEMRELPAVASGTWEIDMGAALACLMAELKEFGEVSTFESAHIILSAEPASDASAVAVDDAAPTVADYVDDVPAGGLEFPRACL
jgi:hypothetical protein